MLDIYLFAILFYHLFLTGVEALHPLRQLRPVHSQVLLRAGIYYIGYLFIFISFYHLFLTEVEPLHPLRQLRPVHPQVLLRPAPDIWWWWW